MFLKRCEVFCADPAAAEMRTIAQRRGRSRGRDAREPFFIERFDQQVGSVRRNGRFVFLPDPIAAADKKTGEK